VRRAGRAVAATLLLSAGLLAVVEPASAAPAVTVTPDRPLIDGETITLRGVGFPAGQLAGTAQCTADVVGTGNVFEHCDQSNIAFGTVAANGRIRLELEARRYIQIDGVAVDCAVPGTCVTGITAFRNLSDPDALVAVPMRFDSSIANDPPVEIEAELDGWTSRRVDVTVRCSRPANITIDTFLTQDQRRLRAVVKGDRRVRCVDAVSTPVLLVPTDVRHGSTNRITRLLPGRAEVRLTVRGGAGRWSDRVDVSEPVDVVQPRLTQPMSQPHGDVRLDIAGLRISPQGRAVMTVQATCDASPSRFFIYVTALDDAPGGAHRRMLGSTEVEQCAGTQSHRVVVDEGANPNSREDILPAGRLELYAQARIDPVGGLAGPAVTMRPVRSNRAMVPASIRGIEHRPESRLRIGPATTRGVTASMRCGRTVPFSVVATIAQPVGTVVHRAGGRTVIQCVDGRTITFTIDWSRPIRPDVRSAVRLFAINGDHFFWNGPWQQTQQAWRIVR